MVRERRPLILALTALGISVLMAAPAIAQPRQPGGPGGFGGRMDPMMLLGMPQVEEELQLVDDQKAKLKAITDEFRSQMREMWGGFRDIPQDQREAKMKELRTKMEEQSKAASLKVKEILLPHQQARLSQIALQMQLRAGSTGVGGLVDNQELANSLGLTADQKEKLKAIRDETQKKLREVPAQIAEEATRKAKDVLTPEQREKLEKALGAKFEFQFGRPGGNFRGGRRAPEPKN